jgi:hypothetical protein
MGEGRVEGCRYDAARHLGYAHTSATQPPKSGAAPTTGVPIGLLLNLSEMWRFALANQHTKEDRNTLPNTPRTCARSVRRVCAERHGIEGGGGRPGGERRKSVVVVAVHRPYVLA